jgi:hypothetical protein
MLVWFFSGCKSIAKLIRISCGEGKFSATKVIKLISYICMSHVVFILFPQIAQHYSKPRVTPVEVMPVFPDFKVSTHDAQQDIQYHCIGLGFLSELFSWSLFLGSHWFLYLF